MNFLPPDDFFEETYRLSLEASENDEVPIGSIICHISPETSEWEIIGRGRNRIIETKNPTAHAEIFAIREACLYKNSERLNSTIMITSLEPCLMCSGAIVLARIPTIYYFTPLQSGIGLMDILSLKETREKALNHKPAVYLKKEYLNKSSSLLREFFQKKRTTEKEKSSPCDYA